MHKQFSAMMLAFAATAACASIAYSQALEELESVLDKEAAGEPIPAEQPAPVERVAPAEPRPAPPKANIVAEPPPGYLGMYAIEVDGRLLVESVYTGSPAAAAGLRAGDQILRIGGAPISTLDEMSQVLDSLPAGTRLSFLVKRIDRDVPLVAILGQRAATPRIVERSPTPQPTPADDSYKALGELERLLDDAPPADATVKETPAGDASVAKRVQSLEAELRMLNARIQKLETTLSSFSTTDE
jgi:predicted metalloprotease with PDZ domain